MKENINKRDLEAFRRVMSSYGRSGGSVSSDAKRKASRSNGVLGGRRSKDDVIDEEAAYLELTKALKAGVSGKPIEEKVTRWVASCGRFHNIISKKWKPSFGSIDNYNKAN